ARAWGSLRRQEQHRAVEPHERERPALSRQHLVRPLSNNSTSREGAATSGNVPGAIGGMVRQAARNSASRDDARSISRNRKFRRRCKKLRDKKFHRLRDRRAISSRSTETDFVGRFCETPSSRLTQTPYNSVPVSFV